MVISELQKMRKFDLEIMSIDLEFRLIFILSVGNAASWLDGRSFEAQGNFYFNNLSLFIYVYFLTFRKQSVCKEKIFFVFTSPIGKNTSILADFFMVLVHGYIDIGSNGNSTREEQIFTIYIL